MKDKINIKKLDFAILVIVYSHQQTSISDDLFYPVHLFNRPASGESPELINFIDGVCGDRPLYFMQTPNFTDQQPNNSKQPEAQTSDKVITEDQKNNNTGLTEMFIGYLINASRNGIGVNDNVCATYYNLLK